MTDAFQMHPDFPMDQAYSAKAAERGFGRDRGLELFEEWRSYWTERGEPKTPRGWLACWNNNLIRKAKGAAVYNGTGVPRNRFERRPQSDALPSTPKRVEIGGRIYSAFEMIGLQRKQSLRQPLDPDEQAALEKWNETA